MSFQVPGTQQMPVVYKADPTMVHHMKSLHDHLHNLCRGLINQKVRVETIHGQVFEGTIVNCERGILYLRVENPNRAYGPYTPIIMSLVLFELLLITLMTVYPFI
ncbi:MAG TPA: hypothetical protein GXX18_02460 [Bacillales bacterium]|nr:hypothetical protein [Bacillales bacterium]